MSVELDSRTDLAVLDLLPDPVVVVDREGRTIRANTLARRLLGRDPAGEDAARALPLSDDAGNEWWSVDRPLERDSSVHTRIPERDLWLETGGRRRPVLLTGARHRDVDGRIVLVLCLRRAERRERLDAARSELVATVSHELRSPLTAVKGFTKTLLAKWDRFTEEQKRAMLTTINADADRVTRLLGELLDVSRIDAGRLPLQRSMIAVAPIAQRVAARCAVDLPDGRGLGIAVHDPGDVPAVYADADKVEQVLTNLVENAINYGGGRVQVQLAPTPEQVRVTVSDEGAGIDAEHREHLFTKFYRRSGERHTGTGLGLYIAKGIAEAHGGRIWVESDPQRGTRFHLTLPRGGLELAGLRTVRAAPQRSAPPQQPSTAAPPATDSATNWTGMP